MNLQEIFKRFLRNAALIVGSRVVFGLLNLATSALIARTFGLSELGILVLLQVYARLFSNLLKFSSWQAVLSFGTPLKEKGENQALQSLLGFTLGVDIASVLIAIASAILLIPLAARLFEWPDEVTAFAPIFTISILFIMQGTPNGVMRLVDRVDILAVQFALNAVIRFVGALFAILFDTGLFSLVLIWFAANVISGLIPMIWCYTELKVRDLLPTFDVNWRIAGQKYHRIWRFLFFTNISSSLNFLYEGGSVTVAGALLGSSDAAIFQIVRQFSTAVNKSTNMLGPVISSEFSQLAAHGDWRMFQKFIKRQLLITCAVILALSVVLFSVLGPVIGYIYGPELLKHLWLFQLFILSGILIMMAFSFEPAVLAINKPTVVLSLKTIAVVTYILITAVLFEKYQIYAFGYGFLASQIIYVVLFVLLGIRILKRKIKKT